MSDVAIFLYGIVLGAAGLFCCLARAGATCSMSNHAEQTETPSETHTVSQLMRATDLVPGPAMDAAIYAAMQRFPQCLSGLDNRSH